MLMASTSTSTPPGRSSGSGTSSYSSTSGSPVRVQAAGLHAWSVRDSVWLSCPAAQHVRGPRATVGRIRVF